MQRPDGTLIIVIIAQLPTGRALIGRVAIDPLFVTATTKIRIASIGGSVTGHLGSEWTDDATEAKVVRPAPAAKRSVVGATMLHLGLVGAAHIDLTKRPAEQIRGPKWLWRVLTVANSSFSVAYFV